MPRTDAVGSLEEAGAEDDQLELAFPGCTLSRLLTVIASDQLSPAIEALVAIRASGGGLQAMSLSRHRSGWVRQLRLVGLRPHHARFLANRLALLLGVDRATVEHQLLELERRRG